MPAALLELQHVTKRFPGVLALDVGVPISRADACRSRAADGSCLASRAPVSAYLSFEQTF